MLKRLSFSKNLQCAIKANGLLEKTLSETEIKGGFLTAVCKDNFDEAMMRADDHNKTALQAKDRCIGEFAYRGNNKKGYQKGDTYWISVSTKDGEIKITPSVLSDAEHLSYMNFWDFLWDFKPINNI